MNWQYRWLTGAHFHRSRTINTVNVGYYPFARFTTLIYGVALLAHLLSTIVTCNGQEKIDFDFLATWKLLRRSDGFFTLRIRIGDSFFMRQFQLFAFFNLSCE